MKINTCTVIRICYYSYAPYLCSKIEKNILQQLHFYGDFVTNIKHVLSRSSETMQ